MFLGKDLKNVISCQAILESSDSFMELLHHNSMATFLESLPLIKIASKLFYKKNNELIGFLYVRFGVTLK